MIARIMCLGALIIGYCFGLINVAHIYSKSNHINIHEQGSGNAGTTNMFRVMGIKAGFITLIGDVAKTVAAVFFCRLIFMTILGYSDIPYSVMTLYTGLGVVLGHDFPFYYHFKGGKGMASTAALICCLGNIWMIIIGLAIFFGTVLLTKYVSLASMISIVAEAVMFIIFTQTGIFAVYPVSWLVDCYILFFIIAALLVFQHRSNIKRLVTHSEKKFYFRSSDQIQKDEADHLQKQTDAKVTRIQDRAGKKVDKIQNKSIAKVEHVQNKADYKESKVQLKASLKSENNRNIAGKIADHAPKSLKQNNNEDSNK